MTSERDQWFLECQTSKRIGEPSFVKPFLEAWLAYPDDKFWPTHFDRGEPTRLAIAEHGLDRMADYWVNPTPCAPLIKRRAAPQMTFDVKWRSERGADNAPFPWGCSVWIAKTRQLPEEAIEAFFNFIVDWFEPQFALATTWQDVRRKNKVLRPTYIEGRYVGMGESVLLDIESPRAVLPGIYWRTYIGAELLETLRDDWRSIAPSGSWEAKAPGVMLRPYAGAATIGSQVAKDVEGMLVDALGRSRFFRNESERASR